MQGTVSFWLVPAEKHKPIFQTIINNLATQYGAPPFVPHVTIYSSELTPRENPGEIIEKASAGVQSVELKVDKLAHGERYTKTLFIQFHGSSVLKQLSSILSNSISTPSEYVLAPHMSLIYKNLDQAITERLIASINIRLPVVFFDEIRAIWTPKVVQTRRDVESWREMYAKKLHR